MTEQDNARSLAAGALTRRIRNGDRWFTVYLDRLGADLDHVHWLDSPVPHHRYEPDRPFRANGVLLTRYQVISDDDPTMEIWVQLSAPQRPGERLRITEITFTGNDLTAIALPMGQLREACIWVGGVTGLFWSKDMVLPNGEKIPYNQYKVTLDSRAVPFHRDDLAELTGDKRAKRGSRMSDETLRLIWDAMQDYEHEQEKRQRNGQMRLTGKQKWVAEQTGQKVSNVGEQMTEARRRFGNTKQNRGKK